MIPKFRVWDKEEHKFATWPVYVNLTNSEIVTELWYGYEIQVEEPLQDSKYIVQQSTGLLDKNGTEIYIGDILKWQGTMGHGWFEDVQDEVVYDKQELRFKFKNRNENIRNIANISVIAGNRFEHPNLLRK